jgi:hypothetical protein
MLIYKFFSNEFFSDQVFATKRDFFLFFLVCFNKETITGLVTVTPSFRMNPKFKALLLTATLGMLIDLQGQSITCRFATVCIDQLRQRTWHFATGWPHTFS